MKKAFIAIEGIDGCGKTTLITLLKEYTAHHRVPTVFTKEPGGSGIGKPLRALLQQQAIPLDRKAEYLLFAADRAQHMQEIILPALADNKLVITDRCADSSLAYQGYGLGLDTDMITNVNRWAMQNIAPDLVIYLHLTPEKAMERIKANRTELTTFELRPLNFWHKVYEGYQTIFHERDNVLIIDATQEPNTIMHKAWQGIQKIL